MTIAPDKTVSPPPDRSRPRPTWTATATSGVLPLVVKIVLLGLAAALAVSVTPALVRSGSWVFLGGVWAIVVVLLAVYATKRAVPLKYLVPGTLFLVVFVVYPILMTAQLSATNYGDGTRNTKEATVARIIGASAVQVPDAPSYTLAVGTTGSVDTGPFTFFLVDEATGDAYAGDDEGLTPLDADEVTITDGTVTEAPGYTLLTRSEINDAGQAGGELEGFTVPAGDNSVIRQQGFSAIELTSPLVYDEATDTITNTETGVEYTPQRNQNGDRSYFTAEDGTRLSDQSWGENVGFANYVRAFTDPAISRDFVGILVWTLVFAVGSVGSTFALGLFLATVLNDPRMRFQRLYRSLLLLPYAIPGFISLLIWSGFWNRDFGLVNDLLGLDVNWFGDTTLARIAILLTNLWMGFPYMFLVCTGALQSIPSDLKEAASLDGANGFTQFRKVILPLLLVAVAPLLVASFAFNFNNFNAIQLLTEGGPFSPENPTAGGTDILISYTYRLAFGTAAQQIGFASAISVLLFILTGLLAAAQFRATRSLEDVN
ncbi:ABC transporter permease subunit [Cellulomonas marina]|uniref:Maltose/maltodextrin transport system permease protein n=1 Tax=Cellulomonas marina TaxID=988821 RepID=A0A1I0VXJ1_9CELL|nr:ABC transporter permease subunit [Cellulomonas marina]GIG27507.1 sugar ABC transporter permease [Cellulomonas marina]SFA80603.1 arabinogalactan oligomer / maltooligosaccharide transport system permease protein [Cellulomonas marina]